jgi:lysyl-tRNA synthetase class 2
MIRNERDAKKLASFRTRIQDPRRQKGTRIRSEVTALIRAFFNAQGFLETPTPLLVPCPGMEVHIQPFKLESGAYLPTSPEFAMKRLLVGGLNKIFQICPAFRYEPNSPHHHPEFTMLEWYRTHAGYEDIMRDTENLFESIAVQLFGQPKIPYQGKTISVKTPWPRMRVRDLFLEHAQVDLVKSHHPELLAKDCERLGLKPSATDSWNDLYFRIWLNFIEPKLPQDQAVFVTRYPASQSALAVIDQDTDGSRWSKRFELYLGGLELGNAFEELTDPVEQRERFIADMQERKKLYGEESPIDEGLLAALEEGLPPSGGIAIGVDRMVMLFADESDIDYTLWLPSFSGKLSKDD